MLLKLLVSDPILNSSAIKACSQMQSHMKCAVCVLKLVHFVNHKSVSVSRIYVTEKIRSAVSYKYTKYQGSVIQGTNKVFSGLELQRQSEFDVLQINFSLYI